MRINVLVWLKLLHFVERHMFSLCNVNFPRCVLNNWSQLDNSINNRKIERWRRASYKLIKSASYEELEHACLWPDKLTQCSDIRVGRVEYFTISSLTNDGIDKVSEFPHLWPRRHSERWRKNVLEDYVGFKSRSCDCTPYYTHYAPCVTAPQEWDVDSRLIIILCNDPYFPDTSWKNFETPTAQVCISQ